MKNTIKYVIGLFLVNFSKSVQSDSENCDLKVEPIDLLSPVTNLTMISSLYKPFVYYSWIIAKDSQTKSVPDYVFTDICVHGIKLSRNHLESFSPNSFTGIAYVKVLRLEKNQIISIKNLIRSLDIDTLLYLDLSRNSISRLNEKFTIKFNRLQTLFLQHNNIESIDDFVFENLVNLTELNLSYNRLKIIGNFTLFNMVSLKTLDLVTNSIDNVAEFSFATLSSLIEVDMSSNNIQVLNCVFNKNKTLRYLYMDSNKIRDARFDPVGLFNLIYLSFFNNFFEMSSVLFTNLSNLETLQLSNVDLRIIKKYSFSRLVSLKKLYMFQANIDQIESNSFRELISLSSLYLNLNMISRLEEGMFNGLFNISLLDLSFNIISEINANVFESLTSLRIIELSNNQISVLPERLFDCLKNVQTIYLSFNRVKLLRKGVFRNLTALETLELQVNQIETLELDVFFNLTKLSRLDLSKNKLRIIKNYYFKGLTTLSDLSLNENRINHIEKDSFGGLENLNSLDLTGNLIIEIDAFAFRDLACYSLILSETQIDVLDHNIFKSSKINAVYLEHNFLEHLFAESMCHLFLATQVYLSFNRIKTISDQLFCQDTNQIVQLNKLYLDHNELKDLSFLRSRQLSKLSQLDVSFNSIECLFTDHFEYLKKLSTFVASNNPIKRIDFNVFDQLQLKTLKLVNISMPVNISLKNLKSLDLSQNNLINFDFFNVQTSLQQLYLRKINLDISQIDFSKLPNLESLDLSFNLNQNFSISYLKSISDLTLTNMKLTSISQFNLPQFDYISFLNLSYNQLKSITKSDIDCYGLIRIDLSHNRIEWIDSDAFVDIALLQILNLDYNCLRKISINNFNALLTNVQINYNFFLDELVVDDDGENAFDGVALGISHNSISSIDFSLFTKSDSRLKTLVLSYNRLNKISSSFLENFKIIDTLNLTSNSIDTIEPYSFRSNQQITYLNLANNSISTLDSAIFFNLVRLKYLYLNQNRLEYIDQIIFSRLVNLEILDLGFNKIKLIENNALTKQFLLKVLSINDNSEMSLAEKAIDGLDSIINIHVSFDFFNASSNQQIFMRSLKPHQEDPINGISYYRSINILYEIDVENAKVDCDMVLKFAKNNLQINLKTDYHLLVFLSVCQNRDFEEGIV